MSLIGKILSGLGINIFQNQVSHQPEEAKTLKVKNDFNFRELNELLSTYFQINRNYTQYYKEISRIKEIYIAEIILEQLAFDVLTPDISSQNIIEIVPNIDNKELKDALKEFEEIHNIDQLVSDIIQDLIAFGSYPLRLVIEEGKGIVEIIDDLEPYEVIPFYRNQELEFYLRLDEYGNPEIHSPHEFVVFLIDAKRIKLKLDKRYLYYIEQKKGKQFPRYIKVGSPLFSPGVIKKIKELDLLEKLIPASKINTLSKGNVVGVYVPPSMSPEEALEFAKKIERKLNALGIGINKDLDQLSITDILKGAGRIKVIPVTNEKGQVVKIDYKPEEPSDLLDVIQNLREVILTSIGIPPELIFNTGNSTKGEILKRYSRYLRKLKYIQKAIVNGLKELVLIHLVNKGLSVTPKDFSVRFTNTLVNVDDLDKLEFQQATTQILTDIKRFVDELKQDEELSQYVNNEGFVEYLNNELTKVNLDKLIQLPGEEK